MVHLNGSLSAPQLVTISPSEGYASPSLVSGTFSQARQLIARRPNIKNGCLVRFGHDAVKRASCSRSMGRRLHLEPEPVFWRWLAEQSKHVPYAICGARGRLCRHDHDTVSTQTLVQLDWHRVRSRISRHIKLGAYIQQPAHAGGLTEHKKHMLATKKNSPRLPILLPRPHPVD
jgi:hypothetical protein